MKNLRFRPTLREVFLNGTSFVEKTSWWNASPTTLNLLKSAAHLGLDLRYIELSLCQGKVITSYEILGVWGNSWWRHQMESFSALLAICPHKGQWRGALMFSLICAWINRWVNIGRLMIWDAVAPIRRHCNVIIHAFGTCHWQCSPYLCKHILIKVRCFSIDTLIKSN